MAEMRNGSSTIRFGIFEVDPRSGELRKGGTRVKLQEQPFKILLALLDRPGQVVTREELQTQIWPQESFGDFDHAVNVAVAKLRIALGDSPETPRFVETLHRRGYRFIGSVIPPLRVVPTLPDGTAELQSFTNAPPPDGRLAASINDDAKATTALPSVGRKSSLPKLWWIPAILVALLLAIVPWLNQRRLSQSGRPQPAELQISKLTNKGNVFEVAISPDGRYSAYLVDDKDGTALWVKQIGLNSDAQILAPQTPGLHRLTFSPDANYLYFTRRSQPQQLYEDLYVMPMLGGTPKIVIRRVDSPAGFSPDGRRITFIRTDPKRNVTEVRIADIDGANEKLITTMNETGTGSPGGSWSPDGQTLGVVIGFWSRERNGSEIRTISLADGSMRTLYSSKVNIGRPVWLPGGASLLVLVQMADRAGRGQLWTVSYPQGEAKRVTHDLEDYDAFISITKNGDSVAAIGLHLGTNIYVAPASDPLHPRQITFGQDFIGDVVPDANGKLLISTPFNDDGELWLMTGDGSQRRLFSNLRSIGFASRCGSYVIFTSWHDDIGSLTRVDQDGLNPKSLNTGNYWSPVCSPDNKDIFYVDWVARPQRILRISLDGGDSTEVAKIPGDELIGTLTVSPDGKYLAFPFHELGPTPKSTLVIIPSSGGSPVKSFPGVVGRVVWSVDGRGIYHYDRAKSSKLVEQSLDGGDPRFVLSIPANHSFNFNWSTDGKTLYTVLGQATCDAILIRNFQ